MVLLHHSLLRKRTSEQMLWLAAERAILYTTKKFVKSVSVRMTSQPIKINGKSSAYFLSLFLDAFSSTSYILPRTEEVGAALHMLGALRWSYNAQKLFCIILFPEILVCVFFARFITRELTFGFSFWHGDLKWLKTEVVLPGSDTYEQELNRMLRLVSWLKCECRLAVVQPTSQTQKGTRTTGCWRIWCPHERMGLKIILFLFFWGRA